MCIRDRSVTIGRIYVRSKLTAMRPKNEIQLKHFYGSGKNLNTVSMNDSVEKYTKKGKCSSLQNEMSGQGLQWTPADGRWTSLKIVRQVHISTLHQHRRYWCCNHYGVFIAWIRLQEVNDTAGKSAFCFAIPLLPFSISAVTARWLADASQRRTERKKHAKKLLISTLAMFYSYD